VKEAAVAEAFHQTQQFTETVKRLLRRNAGPNLRKILGRTHPSDLAHALDRFLTEDQLRLLAHCGDDERQAEVLAAMSESRAADLMAEMPLERAVTLLREMSGDDRADILGELDEELAHRILAAMPDEESHEASDLLRYDEATAGGIMSPDMLAIPCEVTAGEAIRIVQDSPDVEMAFYIYVVDGHQTLVGVVSLRQLVISKPDVPLQEIMNPQVVSVRTSLDQEDVARIVARYDLLAVPVVDETNTLVGVVTVDDVIDVIKEEATEDILKMAGAGENLDERRPILGSVWRRAPWLLVAWIGGVIASIIIGRHEETLREYVVLVAFIPIIVGMAGNVGTQSLAVVVRGLATRRIDVKQFWRVLGREVSCGVLLGVIYGAALGGWGVVKLGGGDPGETALILAALVGAASAISMVIAAAVGSTIPLLLARLRIDPAVATGPFVTTAIDILGVLVYFHIVGFYLGL